MTVFPTMPLRVVGHSSVGVSHGKEVLTWPEEMEAFQR